ncbi:hypothetical protein LTR78_003521 [Recurvomyces mirabilis]|uniref:Beta-lactamase-related domain-containing protein n=1 Tax=Recurvomyces mirabilis TaxID=574656 RepID=A0AAE1C3G4_9PEZI|nr:hypothetical protein LTR78_003521 [Recurvomyces mirabilis]KAK5154446.1 hypothetical protein LTS14_006581 [Recurvomyces mirabilis]
MSALLCLTAILKFFFTFAGAQKDLYVPCPLLGPPVPPPLIDPKTAAVQKISKQFSAFIDQYVAAEKGDFGPVTPNKTSFSIALFAGSNYVASEADPSFFYEYHHEAGLAANNTDALSADSKFAVGELTQLFTVYALLIELGDEVLGRSITYHLPELKGLSNFRNALTQVRWEDVTLASLAGHMSGVARSSEACSINRKCSAQDLLKDLAMSPPIYLPETTPIFSDAAFQLLAAALERETGKAFAQILSGSIFSPLNMTNTSLLAGSATNGNLSSPSQLYGNDLLNTSYVGEPAALGLTTTIQDLSTAGRAMLTSHLISPATTRRWLKPHTSTSNIKNSVGRPWEIYHYGSNDSVMDIYTKSGSLGSYGSYFGLVPDYDIGFAILAVNHDEEAAPDLNAYADMCIVALNLVQKSAYSTANETLAGTYRSLNCNDNSSLVLDLDTKLHGLHVSSLALNGTDYLATIAALIGAQAGNADIRLYPTNLVEQSNGVKRQAFRAVIQDMSEFVDAGTPTCVSWQTIDILRRGGLSLDRVVLEYDSNGTATAIEWPALDVEMQRQQ